MRSAPSSELRRRRSGQRAFLGMRDDDQVPLQALAAMGGQQADRLTAHSAVGERVGRDLLGGEGVEELPQPHVAGLLLGAGGRFEERTDRVEVAVGQAPGLTPLLGLAAEPRSPVGAVPERPEHLLGARAGVETGSGRADQGHDAAGAVGALAGHVVEEPVGGDRTAYELARGYVGVARAQRPGQRPQVVGVEPSERRGQQRLRPVGGDEVGVGGIVDVEVDDHPQRCKKRQHRWLAHERGLVAGHLHGDPGPGEGAA